MTACRADHRGVAERFGLPGGGSGGPRRGRISAGSGTGGARGRIYRAASRTRRRKSVSSRHATAAVGSASSFFTTIARPPLAALSAILERQPNPLSIPRSRPTIIACRAPASCGTGRAAICCRRTAAGIDARSRRRAGPRNRKKQNRFPPITTPVPARLEPPQGRESWIIGDRECPDSGAFRGRKHVRTMVKAGWRTVCHDDRTWGVWGPDVTRRALRRMRE